MMEGYPKNIVIILYDKTPVDSMTTGQRLQACSEKPDLV